MTFFDAILYSIEMGKIKINDNSASFKVFAARTIQTFLFLTFCALCSALPSHAGKGGPDFSAQAEYSADSVMTTEGMTMTSKVFYSRNKQRTEMMGNISITRQDKKVLWTLMPQSKSYMEMELNQDRLPPTERSDVSMKEVGHETINGFTTTKYHFEGKEKEHSADGFIWVTKEGAMIKMEATSEEKGKKMKVVSELKNLKFGKQDDSLFEIPSGYSKSGSISFGAGMMQFKGPQGHGDNGNFKMFTDSKMEKFTETANYSAKIDNNRIYSSANNVRLMRDDGGGYGLNLILARDKNILVEFVPNMCAYTERKAQDSKLRDDYGYMDLAQYDIRFKKNVQTTENGIASTRGDVETSAGGKNSKGSMVVSDEGIVMMISISSGFTGPSLSRTYTEAKAGKQDPKLFEIPKGYKKLAPEEFDNMLSTLGGRAFSTAAPTYCNGGKGPATTQASGEKKDSKSETLDTVNKGLDTLKNIGGLFGR